MRLFGRFLNTVILTSLASITARLESACRCDELCFCQTVDCPPSFAVFCVLQRAQDRSLPMTGDDRCQIHCLPLERNQLGTPELSVGCQRIDRNWNNPGK